MREIVTHKVLGDTGGVPLRIVVVDDPAPQGASHHYQILGKDGEVLGDVKFQNGPIGEVGVNGVTHEALLAIVADRLEGYQSGPYACRENALSLTSVQQAMHWLFSRTIARLRRGVEGTMQK